MRRRHRKLQPQPRQQLPPPRRCRRQHNPRPRRLRRQHGHALNMMRLRKHIHRLQTLHPIRPAQRRQIPRQRLRVARHIGDAPRTQPQQSLQNRPLTPGTRRIQNHRIRRRIQFRQNVLNLPRNETHIIQPGGVLPGIGHRRAGLLNGDDPRRIRRQQRRESAHAAVSIHHRLRTRQPQPVPHQLRQPRRLRRIHLKERRRRHPKLPPGHRLPVAFLPRNQPNIRPVQRRLHQVIPGRIRRPYGQLRSSLALALQFRQRLVDLLPHQHTAVNPHKPPPLPVREPQRAAGTPHIKSGVVAIVKLPGRGQNLPHRRLPKPPDAPHRIPHNVPLRRQLPFVPDMLPLTPGAFPEIPARRRDAVARCPNHPRHLRRHILPPDGHHLGQHPLPRNAAEHENIAPARPARHRLPQPSPGQQLQL